MLWDEVIGQEDVVAHFRRAIQDQSLSHAYLFVGSEGVGKSKVARTFAATLNCPSGGCGICPACLKILHRTHPDVLIVEPEGNFILLEQIHQLLQKAVLRPIDAPYKVFIVEEADSLTEEAANALLKSLEEPPADLIYVLLTSHPEKLLPTIISRCQLVRFKPVSTARLEKILIEKRSLGEERARLVARLSGGVLGEALSLLEDEWKLQRRERVVLNIEKLAGLDVVDMLEVAGVLLNEARKGVDDLKVEQKRQRQEIEELAINSSHSVHLKKTLEAKYKRQVNREETEGFDEILSVFSSWFRDCLIIKESDSEQLLTNLDRADSIRRFSDGLESDKILSCLETIEQTREKMRFNVNMQLAVEVMLLGLQEEIGCQSS